MPDTAFVNGRFTTLDPDNPHADAVFVKNGVFQAVGTTADILAAAGRDAREIDLQGRAVLPGLNDSHIHIIRGGLNYNMELRWDGVPSLADAMQMLRRQVDITPVPQWVRVVGGFTLSQFAEKRLPTLDELNDAAPDTPVFILHLYDRALLNRAAVRACGFDRNSPNPPGGEIEHDSRGEPTGMIVAEPNAAILYIALARGPKLTPDDQVISTRQFMRELNRLGVTSAIDAGGGFQNYPDDYRVIDKLARRNELTVRIAYNLFTQNPGGELEDFSKWTASLRPGSGDDMYRLNGAGEMLVYSAADFEDFRQPRPDMPGNMEGDLEQVVRVLLEKRWPFRLHATYDETIRRALDVFERVDRDIPFAGLHWFFDHAETISPESIDRVAA
ncbi:MAG: amidohydrolase, partial [Planctomycetaceae bacterium]|nr:amidohydrolase [Planctomycetaceae bacterium]